MDFSSQCVPCYNFRRSILSMASPLHPASQRFSLNYCKKESRKRCPLHLHASVSKSSNKRDFSCHATTETEPENPDEKTDSFGAITRITNMVANRTDLLKLAAAGPLAGFSLGFIFLLLGFILPPSDGIGIVVDPGVFHGPFLVGGIAKLLLGGALKEGTSLSLNPLVIWAWAWAGLDCLLMPSIAYLHESSMGGRISFAFWGREDPLSEGIAEPGSE